jgi:AcrR family transcriptional regulator
MIRGVAPSSARTPRLAPEIRRRQLMEATLRVAADRGFANLTVDAIAAEAGVTRPVIYDLFGDLAGLLAAVTDEAFQRANATIDRALPEPGGDTVPTAMLEQALVTVLAAIRADPPTWRLLLIAPQGAPPEIREEVARRRAEIVDRIAPTAGWGLQQLGLGAADPRIVARLLLSTGEEMGRLLLDHPRRYTPERIATTVSSLVRVLPAGPESRGGDGG